MLFFENIRIKKNHTQHLLPKQIQFIHVAYAFSHLHEPANPPQIFTQSQNPFSDHQSDTCKVVKMPNDRRSSSHRYRASPYSCSNKNDNKRTPKSPSLPIGNENEWEETRCPICMEHPHNAVLLVCSSREKGCLPYICDTSARHSNCLDQFQKTFMNSNGEQTKVVCPLCRGQINKWIVVNPAREFMNSKTRSCSMGTCDFSGNYSQLREHARRQHPCVRPTDVDPERELEWTKLEQELEQQDMLSMQFEFDDDDDAIEIMDGLYELASPSWDSDFNVMNFISNFESEYDSFIPDLEVGDSSLFLDPWHSTLTLSLSSSSSSSHESEIEGSGGSRGPSSTRNSLSGMPGENARATRRRTNTRDRQRSNSQPSSHNRQEQVTTLVDFHELRSNMP